MNLQSLPSEILYNIISHLDPIHNIRSLRYLIQASQGTSALRAVAERLLEENRKRLIDKSVCFSSGDRDPERYGDQKRLRELAMSVIGKQFIYENEDENIEGDGWVRIT